MIKVSKNPSLIYTATDYKKIGKSSDTDKTKLDYISMIVGKSSIDEILASIQSMTADGIVSINEKKNLKEKLDGIQRDWSILIRRVTLAGLETSSYYTNAYADYTTLRDFLIKVTADMTKAYTDVDVYNMTNYFNNYYNSTKILEKHIQEVDATSLINVEICSFVDNFATSPNLYAKVMRDSQDITSLFVDGTGTEKTGSSYYWKFDGFATTSTFSTRYADRYDSVLGIYRGASFDLIEGDLPENGVIHISLELDYEVPS